MSEHRPYTLIAELTHRCPLRCPYCSNPETIEDPGAELTTEEWQRVLTQAESLGVMQAHLTGGEPLARKDLELIAAHARAVGLYTNLVTSGIPLTRQRLADLARAGIDNVQLSLQDAEASSADFIAGFVGHEQKLEVARWVKEEGLPLTINVVLHRANLDHVGALIALAEEMSADRIELANTQYAGWALANRDALLPTAAQLEKAAFVARAEKARLLGRMEIIYVRPDYFTDLPKSCMDGWARRFVHVMPDGVVLPCHAARDLPGFVWETIRDRSLADIWERSEAMNRYRGTDWMKEPCQSCDRRDIDFGGCRCQAFALTGDPSRTDPACAKSPDHGLVLTARSRAETSRETEPRYLHRSAPRARRPAR